MIRTQMCHVFLAKWQELRTACNGALPLYMDVLAIASLHPGIMPYLSVLDISLPHDCRIVHFPSAWQEWFKFEAAPKRLSDVMSPEATAEHVQALLQAAAHPCGLHKLGAFHIVGGTKNYPAESIYLPVQTNVGAAATMVGFAVLFHGAFPKDLTGRDILSTWDWLDFGQGTPAAVPPDLNLRPAA